MGKEWDALRDGARESLGRAEQLRYLDHSVFRWWLALDMAPGHFINLGSSLTRLALSDLSFFFFFLFYAYRHLSSASLAWIYVSISFRFYFVHSEPDKLWF
jgi:hypothetical protein